MSVAPDADSTRVVASACPLDCPDACSLDVTVSRGRVVALEGNETNPFTAGFICSKVRHFDRRLEHELRLRTPMVRAPGAAKGVTVAGGARHFVPVSWEEAFELACARLDEARRRSGGESILPLSYGGSNGRLTDGALDDVLFRRLGASRLRRTVCAAPTSAAATGLYGRMPGVAFEDYVQARLIVVWGANPMASNIHLVPLLKQARENGARLVVVDPRRTPLAKQADQHLAPRPGTDLPLALSLLRWLFESGRADEDFLAEHVSGHEELRARARSWSFERAAEVARLDPAELERFAELYANSDPAVIRCGWGLERNRNGGSAVAAVLALPAVAGKFGQRGGGYTLSNASSFGLRAPFSDPLPTTRAINMNRLGRALLEERDPPIEVLFVWNANPLATLPEQERVRRGLEREDLFTIVFDQVLTDTARYADLILPATTFLEHHELRASYGAYVLQESAPAIDPVGEARSNYAVFGELLRRLGLWRPDDTDDPRELARRVLPRDGALDDALERDHVAVPAFGARPVQFVDVFPRTPDGRVQLVPAALDGEAPLGLYGFQAEADDARHPLALISPATERTISSTLGELHAKTVPLALHPDDASERGIAEGDPVRVYNDLGSVLTSARIDDGLTPGVCLLPKGLWSHNTENGRTANALAPDSLTDLGGGACFNDARVQVVRT